MQEIIYGLFQSQFCSIFTSLLPSLNSQIDACRLGNISQVMKETKKVK